MSTSYSCMGAASARRAPVCPEPDRDSPVYFTSGCDALACATPTYGTPQPLHFNQHSPATKKEATFRLTACHAGMRCAPTCVPGTAGGTVVATDVPLADLIELSIFLRSERRRIVRVLNIFLALRANLPTSLAYLSLAWTLPLTSAAAPDRQCYLPIALQCRAPRRTGRATQSLRHTPCFALLLRYARQRPVANAAPS